MPIRKVKEVFSILEFLAVCIGICRIALKTWNFSRFSEVSAESDRCITLMCIVGAFPTKC
jgi:hypothetical protein